MGSLVKEERDGRRAEESLRRGEAKKGRTEREEARGGVRELFLEECARRRRPAAQCNQSITRAQFDNI